MFNITTLNKISPVGLDKFTNDYQITDDISMADGILVRSQDMLSMDFSDNLKAIARAGAGVNNIPLDKCAEKGIVCFNTPGANANAVKELVLSGLLLSARNIPAALSWAKDLVPGELDVAKQVEKGKSQFAGTELKGKTIAILGLGAIGRKISKSAIDLDMTVIGYDPFVTELDGVEVFTELKDMLPKADYISLHLPANSDTAKMVNDEFLSFVKEGAVLLNFSRDKLIDFDALFKALDNSRLKEYITDFPTDETCGKEKIILLPHLGASTEEAEDNCAVMAVNQIKDYLENGNIVNSVNFPKLDMGKKKGKRIAIISNGFKNPLIDIMDMFSSLNIQSEKIMTVRREDGIAYTLSEISGDIPGIDFSELPNIIKARII